MDKATQEHEHKFRLFWYFGGSQDAVGRIETCRLTLTDQKLIPYSHKSCPYVLTKGDWKVSI
jgi:hypothetical protein